VGELLRRKGALWTVGYVKRTRDGDTVFVELVGKPTNPDRHESSQAK
jgi:hypothetical protein